MAWTRPGALVPRDHAWFDVSPADEIAVAAPSLRNGFDLEAGHVPKSFERETVPVGLEDHRHLAFAIIDGAVRPGDHDAQAPGAGGGLAEYGGGVGACDQNDDSTTNLVIRAADGEVVLSDDGSGTLQRIGTLLQASGLRIR